MAKFTITRLLDVSQIMTTKTGQDLPAFFQYMAEFVEQAVRNLRRGLTFRENFACDTPTVSLRHGVPQAIQVTNNPVTACFVVRVVSKVWLLEAFNWYYDDNGTFTVCARFGSQAPSGFATVLDTTTPTPVARNVPLYQAPPTMALDVGLVIIF